MTVLQSTLTLTQRKMTFRKKYMIDLCIHCMRTYFQLKRKERKSDRRALKCALMHVERALSIDDVALFINTSSYYLKFVVFLTVNFQSVSLFFSSLIYWSDFFVSVISRSKSMPPSALSLCHCKRPRTRADMKYNILFFSPNSRKPHHMLLIFVSFQICCRTRACVDHRFSCGGD